MRRETRHILYLIALLMVCASTHVFGRAAQPYSSYWHVADLLNWDPAVDADAPFNRSSVPLRDRFYNPGVKANPNARHNEGRVQSLSGLNPSTSNCPSQGSLQFSRNTFSYWQYVEEMVYWGGSAGEGVIIPPCADAIDAAHRNGVPILGTIFFPPTAYGGQFGWVNEFLVKDGDTFPVADKLIEVAEYYGFEGWFINQETAGGNSTTANNMRDFIQYIRQNSDIRISWYDSMVEGGWISWQGAYNSNNDWYMKHNNQLIAHNMFLDFRWKYSSSNLTNSHNLAVSQGLNPYDIYAGIDTEGAGFDADVNWENIFPDGQPHKLSLGIYKPSWCYTYAGSVPSFYDRMNRYWSGPNGDPSNTTTSNSWKGIAHYIPARSVINDMPFVTNFCTGQGTDFYLGGGKVSDQDWNNRSLQDVLPTWRWIVGSSGTKLKPEIDFTAGYFGGNCLKVSGNLSADNSIFLYLMSLPITAESKLKVTYKSSATADSRMSVALVFEDNLSATEYIAMGNSTGGWDTKSFDLTAYAGRKIAYMSLFFDASSPTSSYTMRIGQIAFTNETDVNPQPPTNVQVLQYFPAENSMRIHWDHAATNVQYYNVWSQTETNSYRYLGSTPNNYYYIPDMGDAEATRYIHVVSVDPDYNTSSPTTISVDLKPSDLLAYWPLDENAGSDAYDLALGNDGSIVNATWQTDGKINSAIRFSNANQGIIVPEDGSFISPTSAISVSAWIKANSWKDLAWQGSIVSKDDWNGSDKGYVLRCGENGKVSFNLSLDGSWKEAVTDAILSTGQWYHVVGTFNGSAIKVYINGVERANNTVSGTISSSPVDMRIGQGAWDQNRNFDGAIDEVSIWSIALSASNITQLYNNAQQGQSLLDWYPKEPAPNGGGIVTAMTDLTWTTGIRSAENDIYLGTNQTAVTNATKQSPEYQATQVQSDTTYTPTLLNYNTTYFWRIDTVLPNGVAKQGPIWSFTTNKAGDFDLDGDVNMTDFAKLSNAWLAECSQPDWCNGLDINQSGMIDVMDIAELAEFWLK